MRKRDVVAGMLRLLVIVAALVAVIWIAGFAWFVVTLRAEPEEPTRATDGIVVLTGAPYRIGLAVSLLAEGRAERLLISGIYAELGNDTLRRINAIPDDLFACCIDLDRRARNTEGNAREAAVWTARHGYRSLRVVTSYDHMPRSLVELRRAMPDIDLVAHPVSATTVGTEAGRPSLGRLALEFTKYSVALARSRIAPGHS